MTWEERKYELSDPSGSGSSFFFVRVEAKHYHMVEKSVISGFIEFFQK